MSKFKVGDKVIFARKATGAYSGDNDELTIGKDYIVRDVDDSDESIVVFNDNESLWYMSEDCFDLAEGKAKPEPLKSKPEIIFMDGGKLKVVFAPPYTILEWKYRVNTYKARSTCHAEDTYDKFEGFRLALERLKAKMNKGGWTVKF